MVKIIEVDQQQVNMSKVPEIVDIGHAKADCPPADVPTGYFQGGPQKPDFQGSPHMVIEVGGDNDVKEGYLLFSDKSIRRAFIRKVYSILLCQLLVTLGFICLFVYEAHVKQWAAEKSYPLLMTALSVSLIALIPMMCCECARRKAPMNIIFLGIFTLAESLLLGVFTTCFQPEVVVMAVGITAAVCLALSLFALQTKWDFTILGGFLLCFLVILIIFGIHCAIVQSKIASTAYTCLGVLLFSFYLVIDTQLMMGGEHKYAISPEEYIFAALNLYLDIINIFLYILRIFGH